MRRRFNWDKQYLYWGMTAFCVIAASIVFPGEELPVHRTDYSYYMEKFERCYDEKHRTFKELVAKEKLVYVHEIQHWLRRHHQEDRLRINESRL